MTRKSLPLIFVAMLFLAGCPANMKEPLRVCPGKSSVTEALLMLESKSGNIIPLTARGQCRFKYYVEDKEKPQSENFAVKLWIGVPQKIYFQADKALVPKAIVLGSNEREFWLAIKPKEISAYWWGRWSEQDSMSGHIINPKILLEAIGATTIDYDQDWSLSNKGPYDILTRRDEGIISKKVYVYSCDYRIRKIEYYDPNEQVLARLEMSWYEQVTEECSIPSSILITTFPEKKNEDTISISLSLKSLKPKEMPDALYYRRAPRGFKDVYRVMNGKWIKQS